MSKFIVRVIFYMNCAELMKDVYVVFFAKKCAISQRTQSSVRIAQVMHITQKKHCKHISDTKQNIYSQTNLPNSSTRNPFILSLQSNLLQCNNFSGHSISCFVDNAVGAFPDLFHFLIPLHDFCLFDQAYSIICCVASPTTFS